MSHKIILDNYCHFIECYYPIPMSWLNLEEATMEYKKNESNDNVKSLIQELNNINKLENWEFIKEFSYKHGFFDYPVERLKEMVNTMIQVLNK